VWQNCSGTANVADDIIVHGKTKADLDESGTDRQTDRPTQGIGDNSKNTRLLKVSDAVATRCAVSTVSLTLSTSSANIPKSTESTPFNRLSVCLSGKCIVAKRLT